MIELADLHKAFNQGQHNEYWAIQGVSLSLEMGKVTALMGPSGSGKTTLLSLIGCLSRPTSGRIRLHGEDISGLPERFLTELRRKHFGFVFQQFNLIKGLSARENVMLPAYPLGLSHRQLTEKADALLEQFRLGPRRDAKVEWLSGGEQQRVAIARALINDPPILVADEPTANLDTALSREFLDMLGELSATGKTVLLTSHDPLVLESSQVHQRIALRDGKVVEA